MPALQVSLVGSPEERGRQGARPPAVASRGMTRWHRAAEILFILVTALGWTLLVVAWGGEIARLFR